VIGYPEFVHAGESYRSDDPRVKGREQLFVDTYELLGVEQAMASPGRRRAAVKPKAEPKVEPEVEPAKVDDLDLID
jgi:hypothetical protein